MAQSILLDNLSSGIGEISLIGSIVCPIKSRPSRIYRKGKIRYCKNEECHKRLSIYNPHNRCSECQKMLYVK